MDDIKYWILFLDAFLQPIINIRNIIFLNRFLSPIIWYDINDLFMKNTKIISVTWQNLSAYVREKPIINDCSGYCRPGEMLAIMGPSGAGKTTLLSIISKRYSSTLKVEGEALANNERFDDKTFHRFGAFVYQNDLLFESLTVRETLLFAAMLKIPNKQAAIDKVEELITEFQLQKCAQTYVGGALMKGISGGEKKRLCVSIQMVSDPSLIILDEPTSGLDSSKAVKLLEILKKLAAKNRTIIFTLHQPSYLQYIKLDRLILLDKGETIYQGPAQKIAKYMESIGIAVDKKSTISDFFMMEISQFKKQRNQGYSTPLNSINYKKHLDIDNISQINSIAAQNLSLAEYEEIFMQSFIFSLIMIMKRDWMNILRGGWKLKIAILQMIMKFLLLGVFFLNEIPPLEDMYNPQAYVLFINSQSCSFNNVAGNIIPSLLFVALSLPAERELYYKETDSKKYHPLPYFLSKLINQNIILFIITLIYASGAYWLQGFSHSFSHFLYFLLIVCVCANIGAALGFFCATLFREIGRVAALTNIVMIPLLILSGMFNKFISMPDWSSWLQYISPFRYGLHLMLLNEYGDENFQGFYDYRTDLNITLSFTQNLFVLIGQGVLLYTLSFLLLKFYTAKISP